MNESIIGARVLEFGSSKWRHAFGLFLHLQQFLFGEMNEANQKRRTASCSMMSEVRSMIGWCDEHVDGWMICPGEEKGRNPNPNVHAMRRKYCSFISAATLVGRY